MSEEKGQEWLKMINGEPFSIHDPQLTEIRFKALELVKEFNEFSAWEYMFKQQLIWKKLFGSYGKEVMIEQPFQCDFGKNIHLGSNIYMNFGCVILDAGEIRIGTGSLLGPGVHLYGANHPMDRQKRKEISVLGVPITIGEDCWLGGNSVVCGGVTIGDGTVIGAGSVVTRDIPAGVFAAGNPCRVIRELEEEE